MYVYKGCQEKIKLAKNSNIIAAVKAIFSYQAELK